MLEKIKQVDPSKKCLAFLHDRVLSENYRGNQISQHNRYNFEQVVIMLEIFHNLVGNQKMAIRTTDHKARPFNLPEENTYANYTNLVNSKFGKGTQDSIRKNLFVDFHRMGLIDRFHPDGTALGPYDRIKVKEVSLTSLGLQLIDKSMNYAERYLIFTRCLDNIMRGLVSDLFAILSELDHITIHEYTFFISFSRLKLGNTYISLEDVIGFTKEFRSLSIHQRNAIVQYVQVYCDPSLFSGNKKEKRDFHNWINESQQVFSLLDMTAYYNYNKVNKRIEFMIKKGFVFSSVEQINKLKRSIKEKKEYFNNHQVFKKIGFELHHVIPLLWARNTTDFFLLDRWQNMLYVDGGIHSVITQSGNKHVILKFQTDNDTIELIDHNQSKLILEVQKNVLYSSSNKPIMIETNNKLLESF